jgi:hypothetical protein
MSNFAIAVGGSGAKLMQSLIHLGAAGLLPKERLELDAIIVDPDSNNGNVHDCQEVYTAYQHCKLLKCGATNLFSASVAMEANAWTPLSVSKGDDLKGMFHYEESASKEASGTVAGAALEADLLDVLFEPGEIKMPIKQGFRGRPAIGAAVLANTVNFELEPWKGLKERIRSRATGAKSVNVLLAGSVFGGSGAAGVPTLVRLIHESMKSQVANLKLAMVLFLPFFQFKPVPGERIQADPAAFPTATAEALKYYHERGFLAFCDSIYAVGEETPAEMAISAVGAAEQRNEPHFLELVAGMGAMRFFSDLSSKRHGLGVAARKEERTVAWADLPYAEFESDAQIQKLQQMAVFAVAYRYIFYPSLVRAVKRQGSPPPFWVDHVERQKVKPEEANKAIQDVFQYVEKFLEWLLHISTPRRSGFEPGLVNPGVFAVSQGFDWRLRTAKEFNDAQFANLLLNTTTKIRMDDRSVFNRASGMKVKSGGVEGAGRLIRALYDACALD